MRYTIWILISAMFVLSLVGMTVSILLWSRRVRDAIIDLWVALGERSEFPDLRARTLRLYATLTGVFMLNAHGRVGKRKTLLISCASIAILSIGMSPYLGFLFKDRNSTLAVFLFVLPISVFWHWLLEYQFSKAFQYGFQQSAGVGLFRRFTAGLTAGAMSIAAILATILLLASPLLLEKLSHYSTIIDVWTDDWPKFLTAGRHISDSKLALFPKLFVMASMLNGMGMLALSVASTEQPNFIESLLMVLSLSSSASIVVLLGISIALTHSRTLLRVAAKACEFVASRDPRLVFMASTTLFALATGLMQAFTFFPMPAH